MRKPSAVPLTLAVFLAAAPACLAAPQVFLSDPALPLWEMRPMDRHVYVLSLEGDWRTPPAWDAEYHINVEYPDGAVVENRPTVERFFRKGEVQVLLMQYQYQKHVRKGDVLTVFVTKRLPGGGPDDWEVVSNRLAVAWPFDRDVVRLPPKTRYSEMSPIDAFTSPGQEPVPPPQTNPPPVPLPSPGEEPVKKPAPVPPRDK